MALIPRLLLSIVIAKNASGGDAPRYTEKVFTYLFRDTDLAIFHWGNRERGFFCRFRCMRPSLLCLPLTLLFSLFGGLLLWRLQWSWLMTTSYTQYYRIKRLKNNKWPRKRKNRFGRPSESSIKCPPFVFGSGNKTDGVIGLFVNAVFVRNFIWHSIWTGILMYIFFN